MSKSKVRPSKSEAKKQISAVAAAQSQPQKISTSPAEPNHHPGNGAGPVTAPLSSSGQGKPKEATGKTASGIDITEKVKELVRLAQEQGYLTYNDINEALPDSVTSPE